jgi:CHASE3 domain sensor protein
MVDALCGCCWQRIARLARKRILDPYCGSTALPFIFFYPAVTLAAFYGGFGPAIVAIVLADLMAGWSFFEPFHSMAVREPLPLFAFAIFSLFIITAIQAMHVTSGRPTSKIAEIESDELPRLTGVFVVMAIVVIGSVIITYWFGLRVVAARDRAAPHRNVIGEADDLLSTLKDPETGQRGFIITGDEQYLEPYKSARAGFPKKMSKLRNSKIFTSPDELNEIERLAGAKLDELERTIAARRSGGFDAAVAIVRIDQGKETMDLLRDRIGPGHGCDCSLNGGLGYSL